ncbi:hypothetical protein EON65_56225 [archaeon]|nr:MAG: hypothetical protein EON65_56225 [archaeon]
MNAPGSIDALSSILNRIDAQKHKIPKLSQINPALASYTLPPSSGTLNASHTSSSSSSSRAETKPSGHAVSKDSVSGTAVSEAPLVEEILRKSVWHEFFDPSSLKTYYHCYETSETTWTKPDAYIPCSNTQPSASHPPEDGTYRAFFNSKQGRLSMQSHWEQVRSYIWCIHLC